MLTESLLLAVLGAGLGLLFSNWMTRYLLVMAADGGTVLPLRTGIGFAALGFTCIVGFCAGRSIRIGDSTQAEIVGVVADIKDHELVGATRRRFYLPLLQQALGDAGLIRLVVRAAGDPAQIVVPVRKAMNEVVTDLPIRGASPLSRLMRDSIREERLLARLAILFGAAALVLAAVGLYGVLSYPVSRRAGEIGLRVALGAQRRAVVRMVLRDALLLVAIGMAAGIPLTIGASRIIRSQLHGVGPNDPVAFVVALAVLALGALGAALLPALRASRVAPLVALRAE